MNQRMIEYNIEWTNNWIGMRNVESRDAESESESVKLDNFSRSRSRQNVTDSDSGPESDGYLIALQHVKVLPC